MLKKFILLSEIIIKIIVSEFHVISAGAYKSLNKYFLFINFIHNCGSLSVHFCYLSLRWEVEHRFALSNLKQSREKFLLYSFYSLRCEIFHSSSPKSKNMLILGVFNKWPSATIIRTQCWELGYWFKWGLKDNVLG